VKIGSFWPDNPALGLPRHGTTTILIDQKTGRVLAVIEAAKVNAYRTAAADAVAASLLARPDSRRLAIFGAGHQAFYECEALARIRPIEEMLVVARNPARAEPFCAALGRSGLRARLADARTACGEADIIVTATTATQPLFEAAWVRPGTHVASMGSDAVGKQELPPALFAGARLFADLPAQSRRLGEFQHAAPDSEVTAIGDVIAGRAEGRRTPEEITIFDSSGLSVQDIHVAAAILDALGPGRGTP
jgi:ornithine cyclodeaminase